MAPGFPTTFEKEHSPLSPSAASGSNTPISYKANVNRNKTRKWADAKPVDYDDWGEDDEYDLPPPPVLKPTGLRQQGQGLQPGPSSASTPTDKRNYGELPPLPAAEPLAGRPRLNSFDADDEKRTFSNTTARQPSAETTTKPAPATRFSQITGQPSARDTNGPPALSITTQALPQNDEVTGLRKASQVVSPVSGSPHPDVQLPRPGRTNTGESNAASSGLSRIHSGESDSVYSQPSETRTPSSDYQARRDFSPTAVPAPLSTTRSIPSSAVDTPSSRFPARKSSLSQSTVPDVTQIVPSAQETTPKPWVADRSSSPGASARSPTTPSSKALPFIRPADIYRRVEEERERERQSMDSSRPSLDSLVGIKSNDGSDSPAKPLREKTSSDSLGSRQRLGDDTSISGRHLQPMLEPVKERKSEYGFEGFNSNAAAKTAEQTGQSEVLSEHTPLDLEHARSSSVSPKLPDLNRMSGFGMDLFSQPKFEAPSLPLPHESVTPALSNITSTPTDDTAPGRQISLGYRSAVNQAFDRKDDSSVPPTPASQTGSNVRRSDSESTGTTGISPIMSRAPSGAFSDVRGREGAALSMLEVVHEPISPVGREVLHSSDVMDTSTEPGHRRDSRTSSPGKSPARKPNIAQTEAAAGRPEVALATPSSPDADTSTEFRPSLPGGWTSYATTARDETSQQESVRISKEADRGQTSTSQSYSAHEEIDAGDRDITPTATIHSLPQAAFGATTGSGLAGGAGAAFLENEKHAMLVDPTMARGGSALPTPDPAVTPSGNLYSSAALDPPVLPRLESASLESQVRSAPVQREEDDSDAPMPPTKDTPPLDDFEEFPNPTVPLKQRTLEQVEADESPALPMRPQVLPTLSTDTRLQDEESDKLRKEIIKSLSPQIAHAAPRHDSLEADQIDDQAAPNDGRFSYLPKEYDNYWATTAEDAESASLATLDNQTAQNPQQPESSVVTESASNDEAPWDTRRMSMATESRPPIPHRFSWETSAEDVSPAQSREEVPAVPAVPAISSQHGPHKEKLSEVPGEIVDNETAAESSRRAEQGSYSQYGNMDYDKELGAQGLTSPVSEPSEDGHKSRDAASLTSVAALGGGAAAAAVHSNTIQSPQHAQPPQRRLSLAEEKDPRVSSYPVSPTPPEEEHPSRSPQAYFSGSSGEHPVPSAAPSSVSPFHSPVKTQFSPGSRILAFKEITAINTPQERIETFDVMRQRFATMDSGLFDWITNLKAQHPEHADATGSWNGAAFSVSTGPTGSKYAKTAGHQLPPLQQPYYQQYLNASPTTPGTPVSRPGPSTPSGSQQGFSPAGGKLTGHQVQAKGKELLHTAGIFGGKAGKAGKGLLAKGKNKLRGSGAGDKISPNLSPPTKPKNERRTSWGLAISRPSGRPDASSRESNDSIPMPVPTPERQQASTTHSQSRFPALEITTNASRASPILLSDALISPESQNRPSEILQTIEPTLSRGTAKEQLHTHESEEERDDLGVPAPITKNQPSWDPFNATPITEEEGSQSDDRPKQQPQVMHSAVTQKSLAIPDDTDSKSERSNSGDAQFCDAPEERESDLNDWVMVSPEPEGKQKQPEKTIPRPVSEVYDPPAGPPPGFLEQQQLKAFNEPNTIKSGEQPPSVAVGHGQVQLWVEPSVSSESQVFHPPEGPPPTFLNRQQTDYVPQPADPKALVQPSTSVAQTLMHPGMIAAPESEMLPLQILNQQQMQNKLEPQVSGSSQEPATSVLNRPRFSYEAFPEQSHAVSAHDNQASSHYSHVQQTFVRDASEQQPRQGGSEEPARNGSFRGLPPIRRTSTFGLGFGRKNKTRFPIDDEDELTSSQSQHEAAAKEYEAEPNTTARVAAGSENQDPPHHQIHHTRKSSTNLSEQRIQSMGQAEGTRPDLNQAHSSGYSHSTGHPQAQPQSDYEVPRAAVIPREGTRTSQDSWRPNAVPPPAHISPVRYSGSAIALRQRPSIERQRSMEGQRSRGLSESSQGTTRPEIQYNDGGPRPFQGPPIRPMLYDQPPSSAQRYPELFQAQQQPLADLTRDGELSPDMYQAPISREAAFLPRQQTNEYQLPGVGPPTKELRPDRARRNSGSFLKDLGGRISRGASRERGSFSRDGGQDGGVSPSRAAEFQGYEYPESSIASEEAQEQKKRRSSFFGSLNRASTTGLGPPQSRESVVAHFPGSRTDLLDTTSQSLVQGSERKKSFFGAGSTNSSRVNQNKLTRSTTSGVLDEPGKKKRFSGLSSMFSRTGNPNARASVPDQPHVTRESSITERQLIESPQFDQGQIIRQQPLTQIQNQDAREPSQPRQFFSRLSTGGDKNRRASASNLLSGIMGRKTDEKDRSKEDSSSQGTMKQSGQSMTPQQIPLGQTYTDIRAESSSGPIGPPRTSIQQPQSRYQERPLHAQNQSQDRGRRASREPRREARESPGEPRYDSVPIPGGYSLVRGQGAMIVPTGYDPRGLNRLQQGQQHDPRLLRQQPPSPPKSYGQTPEGPGSPEQNYLPQSEALPQPEAPRTAQRIPPDLSADESYESYTKRPSPRLSREDLLARSPAREQLGQQRPYQLSLPEDEGDRDPRPTSLPKSPPVVSPLSSTRSPPSQAQQIMKQHDTIQRLQQPMIRHPESPAGYPLPDDAFSPINEAVRDIPPPPPPKWPSHFDAQHGHNPDQHTSTQLLNLVGSELDRSDTRRTAISAVSGMSGPQNAGLHVPNKPDDGGREGTTPSPTPPSPAYTPEREASPPPPGYSDTIDEKELERGLESSHQDREQSRGNISPGNILLSDRNIRATTLNRGPSPDLYNASPRLLPPNSQPSTRNDTDGYQVSTSPLVQAPSHVAQTSGMENATALAKAKSLTESRNEVSAVQTRQGVQTPATTVDTALNTHSIGGPLAQGERGRRDAREEKIYYDAETGEEGHAEEGDGSLSMSATSYPGQEWNPYIDAGGWEDGVD
ncbi:hypothetical protein D0Z07_3126 [Hyphodiscus hymeniophilus]|uniref:SWI-SNF chromatin-remodeling complex protein n=1 Tax=Hyphodiscus hymeniophilus TaxID=353542 RepID=A0A9P6VMF0_9HELO|nr:hypothetical protein D0Z07_3126 [Hyphodiscus hymeniophilus]